VIIFPLNKETLPAYSSLTHLVGLDEKLSSSDRNLTIARLIIVVLQMIQPLRRDHNNIIITYYGDNVRLR